MSSLPEEYVEILKTEPHHNHEIVEVEGVVRRSELNESFL